MLKISVQLYMKYLIVTDRNTDMTSLMVLITVETADIFERTVRTDIDFIT